MSRTGGKIIELENISKSYHDLRIIKNFSHVFRKSERLGILGKNGAGKSTLLNIITGSEPIDSGKIKTGQTISFGHYKQQGIKLKSDKRVIDVLKAEAEVISLANGKTLSASQFLEYFMFPVEMQYNYVSKLSGGERRRLALLMVLIKNPNFLILDEPTNDLDLFTLNKLEDFLQSYGGCLVIVSHDRYFMDKLVDHYFTFEGNGLIKDHNGTYSEYREKTNKQKEPITTKEPKIDKPKTKNKTSLSYKERQEYNGLETEIEGLESEKKELENFLNSGITDYEVLREKGERIQEVIDAIDEKTMRWLELDEMA
jgi:ATP-binding cassette subfamily F protein uup